MTAAHTTGKQASIVNSSKATNVGWKVRLVTWQDGKVVSAKWVAGFQGSRREAQSVANVWNNRFRTEGTLR